MHRQSRDLARRLSFGGREGGREFRHRAEAVTIPAGGGRPKTVVSAGPGQDQNNGMKALLTVDGPMAGLLGPVCEIFVESLPARFGGQ